MSFADMMGKSMSRLPDGVYQWEATVIARGVTVRYDPTVGRSDADFEAFIERGNRLVGPDEALPAGAGSSRNGLVSSGTFTIRGGSVVDSNLQEPGSTRGDRAPAQR